MHHSTKSITGFPNYFVVRFPPCTESLTLTPNQYALENEVTLYVIDEEPLIILIRGLPALLLD